VDYWDKPLPFVIAPKSGPLPQMASLLDANRALIGNLPEGYLKRPHWLMAGQALVTAAETGELKDIQLAFECIVDALNEEGWLRPAIFEHPLSPSPLDAYASAGSNGLILTEQPLWRRILPKTEAGAFGLGRRPRGF